MAAPKLAMAPKIPNALPRSFEPLNVVVSRDRAAGAMNAPNAPCSKKKKKKKKKRAKPIRPEMNVTLRPSSEGTFPPSSSRLPKASA